MNKRIAEQVIKKIAETNGISEQEMREEMVKAIMEGYKNPEKSKEWKALFGENTIPSPEQFLQVIAEKI